MTFYERIYPNMQLALHVPKWKQPKNNTSGLRLNSSSLQIYFGQKGQIYFLIWDSTRHKKKPHPGNPSVYVSQRQRLWGSAHATDSHAARLLKDWTEKLHQDNPYVHVSERQRLWRSAHTTDSHVARVLTTWPEIYMAGVASSNNLLRLRGLSS